MHYFFNHYFNSFVVSAVLVQLALKSEVVLFVSLFNYVRLNNIPFILEVTIAAKELHFDPKSARRRMKIERALSCHTYSNTIFIYLWAEEKVTSYWLAINYQKDQIHDKIDER